MVIKRLLMVPTMVFSLYFLAGCKRNAWYMDDAYINSLVKNKEMSLGTIKEIEVNGKMHKVKLIGINEDVDENDNKIRTTWEFMNLISDKNGNSLCWQWNDTKSREDANFDYSNSSIRRILTGNGKFATKAYCSSYSCKEDWDINYTDKTILSMLPVDLQNKIIPAKKIVAGFPENKQQSNDFRSIQFVDKLFCLSLKELGCLFEEESEEDEKTYDYYKNKDNLSRVRKQVNNSIESETLYFSKATGSVSKEIISYSGLNLSKEDTSGGYYWLRSPHFVPSGDSDRAWCCYYDGNYMKCFVDHSACGIAPAFCL